MTSRPGWTVGNLEITLGRRCPVDWNLLERVRAASERARRSEEETDNLAAKVHAAEEWRARLPVPETEE